MNEAIFYHLYQLDNILFELPMLPFYFRMWQVIDRLSQTELDAWIFSMTIA